MNLMPEAENASTTMISSRARLVITPPVGCRPLATEAVLSPVWSYRGQVALLENPHDDAERRRQRQHAHHDRLQRQHHRAERQEQQYAVAAPAVRGSVTSVSIGAVGLTGKLLK
jgi:hypothetical protein